MDLTGRVKAELISVSERSFDVRSAEVVSFLRFADALQHTSGRVVIDTEVDSHPIVTRLASMLHTLYTAQPEIYPVNAGKNYRIQITQGAEVLARQTGLLDTRGRAVRGLPNRLITGKPKELLAVWRGAFLASGYLASPGRGSAVELSCPGMETALALVGAATRLGLMAKMRQVHEAYRVVVRERDEVTQILRLMGAPRMAVLWAELEKQRKTPQVPREQIRTVNFDDANKRRSHDAATASAARVERALEILGDQVPTHLLYAGQLRLVRREVSLEELGLAADPPLTKDAIAGRIRRLLALADKRAQETGVPDTSISVSSN